jgi:hypothetical protein
VPEIVCTLATRPSAIAGESAPRMSFAAAPVKVGRPVIGRYSWSSVGSVSRRSSAYETGDSSAHRFYTYIARRGGAKQVCTYLAHDGQDPRLVLVIAVRADAEIDLLLERVGLVRGRQLEDRVGRGERDGAPSL